MNKWVTPAKNLGRFDDLIFCPLNLPEPPSVDADRFIEWMSSDATGYGKAPKEHFERFTGKTYPWLMRVVSGDMDEFAVLFPEVHSYCAAYPLKSIRTFVFLAQDGYQSVFPHADSDGLVGLRLYLANKNSEGLHFFKGRERYDKFCPYRNDDSGNPISANYSQHFHMDEPVYARFPKGQRAFMLNSARAIHAVDANTCKLGDRIAVLIQGELDVDRYENLIESSLEKFADYAIWYK